MLCCNHLAIIVYYLSSKNQLKKFIVLSLSRSSCTEQFMSWCKWPHPGWQWNLWAKVFAALPQNHQNTIRVKIFQKNGVCLSTLNPEIWRVSAHAHWGCSAGSWWKSMLIRLPSSLFPIYTTKCISHCCCFKFSDFKNLPWMGVPVNRPRNRCHGWVADTTEMRY